MRKRDPAKVEEQRQRILRGALKCFARKGVHGSSTDDICRAADVSSGTLYYYFKSRDGLLYELIVHAHQARNAAVSGLGNAPDLLDAIIAAQFASLDAINAIGMTTSVYLELLSYAVHNEAARRAFHEASAYILGLLDDAVRAHQRAGRLGSDLSAEAIALFLPVAMSGMSIAEIADGNFDRQRYRDALRTLLYRDRPAIPAEAAAPGRARR